MTEDEKRARDYGAPRTEAFDVVLVKDGVLPHAAKPEDFKRIPLTAEGAYAARSHAEVDAAEKAGFTVLQVMGPGQATEAERMARSRAQDAIYGAFDRTKV